MTQATAKQEAAFIFPTGQGVLRSKITADVIMFYGRVSLPGIGPCYINGNRPRIGAEQSVLEITKADATRSKVAQIVVPAGRDIERICTITTFAPRKAQRESWSVTGVMRTGTNGAHMSLKLDGVKPARPVSPALF